MCDNKVRVSYHVVRKSVWKIIPPTHKPHYWTNNISICDELIVLFESAPLHIYIFTRLENTDITLLLSPRRVLYLKSELRVTFHSAAAAAQRETADLALERIDTLFTEGFKSSTGLFNAKH